MNNNGHGKNQQTQMTRKQFYFANQSGSVIDDVISLDVAPLVMAELRRQGFYYCYSMPVS